MSNCPLCKREMIDGPSVDKHHLIPRTKKGKETVILHKVCHQKIHSVFSEKQLARQYYTIEKLLENEDIRKFVEWVQNKHPTFTMTHKIKK